MPNIINKSPKWLLQIGAMLMAIGVLLGAFGAHGLKNFATAKALELWQTATLYLFIHALGVLLTGVLVYLKLATARPAYCFLGGVAIFCGSLYFMALGFPSWLGVITPIGGMLFVLGWIWLVLDGKNTHF